MKCREPSPPSTSSMHYGELYWSLTKSKVKGQYGEPTCDCPCGLSPLWGWLWVTLMPESAWLHYTTPDDVSRCYVLLCPVAFIYATTPIKYILHLLFLLWKCFLRSRYYYSLITEWLSAEQSVFIIDHDISLLASFDKRKRHCHLMSHLFDVIATFATYYVL